MNKTYKCLVIIAANLSCNMIEIENCCFNGPCVLMVLCIISLSRSFDT